MIVIKRTAHALVSGLSIGRHSWRFPLDYTHFEVSYNDLTNILGCDGFEVVFGSTNGHKVLPVVATGGPIKPN